MEAETPSWGCSQTGSGNPMPVTAYYKEFGVISAACPDKIPVYDGGLFHVKEEA
ncbi:hypothetical protein U2150_04360 [Methanothermobacter wolfeii]|uniref:Uncharacterized protein n=1 Tax=Methanothermobacter wolfeii TaxID=145261 RepID=A0ABU8TUI8_METWO